MDPSKAILHELYVYCEWNPEPEYIVSKITYFSVFVEIYQQPAK